MGEDNGQAEEEEGPEAITLMKGTQAEGTDQERDGMLSSGETANQ